MPMSTTLTRTFLVAVLAGGLCPAVATAEDKKPSEPAKKQVQPVPAAPVTRESPYAAAARAARQRIATADTVTTEELERRFGAGGPGEPSQATDAGEATTIPAGTGDPLEYMQGLQTAETRRRDAVAKAQAEVDAARLEVAKQERLLLAATNPFVPRPEMSEEERKAAAEESSAERQARARQQLEEAQKRLAAAEARRVQAGR